MAENKAEVKKDAKPKVDVDAFIARKMNVLNMVGTAKANRAMDRVIAKNKGGLA